MLRDQPFAKRYASRVATGRRASLLLHVRTVPFSLRLFKGKDGGEQRFFSTLCSGTSIHVRRRVHSVDTREARTGNKLKITRSAGLRDSKLPGKRSRTVAEKSWDVVHRWYPACAPDFPLSAKLRNQDEGEGRKERKKRGNRKQGIRRLHERCPRVICRVPNFPRGG